MPFAALRANDRIANVLSNELLPRSSPSKWDM